MSTAIATRLQNEIESMKHRAALARAKSKGEGAELLMTGATTLVAGAVGALERTGKLQVSYGKVPTKAAIAVALQGVAYMSKGKVRKASSDLARLMFGLYAYNAGRSGAVVSGE